MGKGIGNLMKQAKKLQDQLLKKQEELAMKTVEASSGGGMVTATANGKGEILAIRIEKEVVDPEDVEMLQDLIVAAVNEAIHKAQKLMQEELGALTAGLGLPLQGLM